MTRPVPTPVVLAWSGGKDSALALATLLDDPAWRVVALLTTVTEGYDRVAMHGIRRSVLVAQAEAIGIPLAIMSMPQAASNAVYEAAFADALARFEGVRHVAFGDLFLEEVRAYREALVARLGWDAVFPLWGRDTGALARELFDRGFRARLTCVDTQQVDRSLVGRAYDDVLLAALPATADPCGENGEFHTLVVDGPMFRRPLAVVEGERVLRDDRFAYCDFVLAAESAT